MNEHPEWRIDLRRLLLNDDFLELPNIVRRLGEAQERTEVSVKELAEAQKRTEARVEELAEAQKRTEARVEELAEAQKRTEARVEELAEAQKHTEARLERLEGIVAELAEAQKRTEARMEELTELLRRQEERLTSVEERLQHVVEVQERMLVDLGELKGWALESRYRDHASGYFGRWLRRVRVIDPSDAPGAEDAYFNGHLTEQEWTELLALDLLVRGTSGRGQQAQEVFLAVEIATTLDTEDVTRAQERAAILRRLGLSAQSAVGGHLLAAPVVEKAMEQKVAVFLDGRAIHWPF
ncbi:MAG: hypothetical protein AB1791_06315 [Chloroflexota bacterium]